MAQLAGWTDARGSLVEFERDIMGRMLRQKNSVGQEQHWEPRREGSAAVDCCNAAARRVPMAAGSGRHQYDRHGRLAERRTGEQQIRYQYDEQGRLAGVDYGDGQLVGFERDRLGRITRARTAEVKTGYVLRTFF